MIGIFKWLSLLIVVLSLMPLPQVTTFIVVTCPQACPSTEEKNYTTSNGTDCIVHRNSCYLRYSNCRRAIRHENPLSIITKAECQAKCRVQTCPPLNYPVCGEYNNTLTIYNNKCLLIKDGCTRDRGIVLDNMESCRRTLRRQ